MSSKLTISKTGVKHVRRNSDATWDLSKYTQMRLHVRQDFQLGWRFLVVVVVVVLVPPEKCVTWLVVVCLAYSRLTWKLDAHRYKQV